MFTLALGMSVVAMVGPLDGEPTVRISRPWGGPPEVIRQVADRTPSSGGIEVPNSAVAGGGTVTVVGAGDGGGWGGEGGGELIAGGELGGEQLGLRTEQLLRAFGYDRDHFGYSYIDYPRGSGGGGGAGLGGLGGLLGGLLGGGSGGHDQPAVDPRVLGLLRDLAPVEARHPPVVPGR
jgi:hypothetical protein